MCEKFYSIPQGPTIYPTDYIIVCEKDGKIIPQLRMISRKKRDKVCPVCGSPIPKYIRNVIVKVKSDLNWE